jgi:hypothetical protein
MKPWLGRDERNKKIVTQELHENERTNEAAEAVGNSEGSGQHVPWAEDEAAEGSRGAAVEAGGRGDEMS